MNVRKLLILLLIIAGVSVLAKQIDQIEGAATSPGVITQLASSSTTNPFGYGYGGLRPVMQRGGYFGNPSWSR